MLKKEIEKMSNKELWSFFQEVLDCVHDRIYLADERGNILMLNNAAVRDYDNLLTREELTGRNLGELCDEGWMEESLTMKVINTKKAQGYIYHEPEGYDLLAWSNPIIKDGKVECVVSTEWDLQSLDTLQSYLNDTIEGSSNFKSELLYYRTKSSNTVDIIAKSKIMQEVLAEASMSARTDATVLIQGETGTGKEVLMKYIHLRGDRYTSPLIEVNCGAVPDNLFESEFFGYAKGAFTGASDEGKAGYLELANHGTLFLDEIESLPLAMQAKLLRVIEEKEVVRVGGTVSLPLDVKIIAATNVNLKDMVRAKKFREDLYYRLNVIPITIPPLRERREDIPELVRYFLKNYNEKYKTVKQIFPKDIGVFLNYPWPGNVRELQNVIERAFITTKRERITRDMLEKLIHVSGEDSEMVTGSFDMKGLGIKTVVEEFEKSLLLTYLPEYKNSRQFAELLGIEKSTVNRKFKKYGIVIPKEPK